MAKLWSMDKEALLETAPLVQGQLRDQRNEICRGYVEWTIFTQDIPDEFKAEDIISVIGSNTGIIFENVQVNSALEKLEEEGAIEHKR